MQTKKKCFFFFRDPAGLNALHSDIRHEFESISVGSQQRLAYLKEKIKQRGFEIMLDYPATFHVDSQKRLVMATGLKDFGQRLFDNLWNATKQLTEEDASQRVFKSRTNLERHCQFAIKAAESHVGRLKELGKENVICSSRRNKNFF